MYHLCKNGQGIDKDGIILVRLINLDVISLWGVPDPEDHEKWLKVLKQMERALKQGKYVYYRSG